MLQYNGPRTTEMTELRTEIVRREVVTNHLLLFVSHSHIYRNTAFPFSVLTTVLMVQGLFLLRFCQLLGQPTATNS